MSYLQEFLLLLPALCEAATDVLGRDPTLVELRSPAYVLGDLHGNYRDLQYFASQFWRTGVDLCPSDLLFLGDYVDRGPHSVELMAYLVSGSEGTRKRPTGLFVMDLKSHAADFLLSLAVLEDFVPA